MDSHSMRDPAGTLVAAALLFSAACSSYTGPENPEDPTLPTEVEFAASLEVDLSQMSQTPSGLYFQDLVEGPGAKAERWMEVTVHYTGWLHDGTQFDSSIGEEPFTFMIGAGDVIQGWDQGIEFMKVGGTRKLVIPPWLAYGPGGLGPIPGDAVVVFDVELLAILE